MALNSYFKVCLCKLGLCIKAFWLHKPYLRIFVAGAGKCFLGLLKMCLHVFLFVGLNVS